MKIIFTIILSITFYNLFASNTTNFPPPYFISHSNIDKTVTGIVTDENGAPLEFVSIGVKGTNNGTYSDESGKFSISVPDNAILVFSYVGYESVEISVNNQNNLNIKMVSNVKLLDQVVVIGYGTAKRIDLTGSSNKIKGAELAAVPYLTATQSLQGKAAGVQITNSGAPGSAPNVRIRGTGSILGGVDPLYVVDGIITDDIRNINASDIVSMDILKDASSTAIYGARAANGVILITTKSGSSDKFSVNYNTQLGMRLLTNSVKMAEPGYYALYSNEAADFPAVTLKDITGSTSWYNQITRPALFQNHNLSVTGKVNKYKFYVSAGYVQENGILIDNNYSRINIRLNHEYAITSKFTIGNTLAASRYVSNNKPYSLFTSSYIAAPIFNAVNPDGTYGSTSNVVNNVGNPYATLKTTNDRSYGNRYQSTFWGEYKILKGLSFKSQIGVNLEHNNGWVYIPEYYTYQADKTLGGQKNEIPDLTFMRDTIYQWVWDNVINYEFNIGKAQNFKVAVGHTAERRDGWKNRSVLNNYPTPNNLDNFRLNLADTIHGQQNFRDPIDNYFRRESFFARLNYKLQDKYLLNATFRRDANSNFPASNRWGNFPSIGIGWIASNESFMKNIKAFDELKIRASYGLVGNDVIRPGQFDLRPTQRLFTYFGTDRVDGAIVTGIVDPNLKWEVVKEFDLGVEFSLWNNMISGEIDYYNKSASDALYTIPYASIGFGNSLLTNAATVKNSGIEAALSWNHRYNKNLSQTVKFNFTLNQNKVTDVGLGRALNFGSLGNGWTATQTLSGQPIGSFWVFKTDGIFQSDEEIKNYPHVINTKPGDFKIVDVNGDKIIDNLDRGFVGSYLPKFYTGLSYGLVWKKFDFNIDLFGNFGNKVYNAKKGLRFGSNYNVEYAVAANRWTPQNKSNINPRASNVTPYPIDYFIESGTFIRVNNITVGYNMEKIKFLGSIDKLRVYASAQNPFIYTPYTGFTPELPGNQNEAGIELNIYPVSATFLIGLNAQF
ncbi:MAG: TonB-dependent receptor [Saprospiraceae bacterium]|nr:TonB-dependent receptor [Saprospiraceae bacterium]